MKACFLFVALFAIGCSSSITGSSTSAAPKEAPAPITPVAPVTPQPPAPPKNLDEALAQSKDLKKPVFLYVGAEWCGPCRAMKANTFTNADVKKKLEDYVCLFCNYDKDKNVVNKYGVNGIPAYFVLNSDGSKSLSAVGGRNSSEFIKWLGAK